MQEFSDLIRKLRNSRERHEQAYYLFIGVGERKSSGAAFG